MEFVVFYDDGSIIGATDKTLDDVKPFGVICIVQEKTKGRNQMLSKKDFYAFNGKHWIVLDMLGIVDHLIHKPDAIKKLIVGRTTDNDTFWGIYDKAKKLI